MISNRDKKFWVFLAVFQLAFGLAIFTVTRYVYTTDIGASNETLPAIVSDSANLNDQLSQITPTMLDSLVPAEDSGLTAAELVSRANEYFAAKKYDQAAPLYERLVNIDPRNADSYNNLGITLHYLGRSSEALQWLGAGTEMDSSNQRIWLTLGFVNKELGNIDAARSALTTAVEMGTDSDVGQSAQRFLDEL